MSELFLRLPCLYSQDNPYKLDAIYERLFDKKVDKRGLHTNVKRFIYYNEKAFNYLGIRIIEHGVDNDYSISFETSNYVGAVPVRMPYDGMVHSDFQVVPRFGSGEDAFAKLTEVIAELDYSIAPRFEDTMQLKYPDQLRPPIYMEAVKYVDLFVDAWKYKWRKFDVVYSNKDYPKANTDWVKYARRSADPKNTLIFPVRENILSTNHKEWQELCYVFNMAKEIIMDSACPHQIRFKYQSMLQELQNKIYGIQLRKPSVCTPRVGDPTCIKALKQQANVLLSQNGENRAAWRIDMAELFERYVQHIVGKSVVTLSGKMTPNHQFKRKGYAPAWTLKYVEPDIMVEFGASTVMGDVKYKSHFFSLDDESSILKETFRADLHQVLGYCSFEPQQNKIGLMFYPYSRLQHRLISYCEPNGKENKIILVGIPFDVSKMSETIDGLSKIYVEEVLPFVNSAVDQY